MDNRITPDAQCYAGRQSLHSLIRHKARVLRERSVELDKLADGVENISRSNPNLEELLWKEFGKNATVVRDDIY